jgi:hypothetical protein
MKRLLISTCILLMLSGCVIDKADNNPSDTNTTNVITNAADRPLYPYFTPWWSK